MTAINYKLLNAQRFASVFNWSVRYSESDGNIFSEKFDKTKINSVLRRNKTIVNIEDGTLYKRVTVKLYGGGVKVRDEVLGNEIKTKKQFLLQKGQFLYSRIDARNGAFGLATQEVHNAIVTNDFPVFDIDNEKIVPEYLSLITSSKAFSDFCQSLSSGTTGRQRISEDSFLDFEIPLPDLNTQNQLVNEYNQKLTQAQEAENQADKLEKGIEDYLLQELGIEKPKPVEKKQGLQLVRLKELSRWDWQFLTNDFELEVKYPQKQLSDFIDKFLADENDKSLRFESFKFPSKIFSYLGMEHIEKNTGTVLEMPEIKGDRIRSQTIKVPKNYFIYGKLRPYLNKYWFNNTDNESIVCSSEFFVFKLKNEVNRLFFEYILSSAVIQKQIEGITSGVRMPRINEAFFKNLQIPLPPKDIQTQIVNHITSQKEQIKALRTQAEALRKQAKADFEKEIFN